MTTVDQYPLVVQGLPYLLRWRGEGKHVKGELYMVPTLQGWDRLDRLEGHPNFYRRGKVEVQDQVGNVVTTTTYFLNADPDRFIGQEFVEEFPVKMADDFNQKDPAIQRMLEENE